MDQIRLWFLFILFLQCFIKSYAFSIYEGERSDTPKGRLTVEWDVSCLSEHMELWIHNAMIEELSNWLSEALQIQVDLACLDFLNLQLSICGFSLYKDPDKNFIFRVSYTGCLVQQQRGFNMLTLNLVRKMNCFAGRDPSVIMRCPVFSVQLNTEKIQCDPEFIQVVRHVPDGMWDDEMQWSLSLSEHLIVASEDASLIQMDVDITETNITVQGRRRDILNPVLIKEDEGEFLALKLVRGQYAYSMEAMCPKVMKSNEDEAVLHIFKRNMGLTKRGSLSKETLTVGDVSVNQTETFTVHETSDFVTLTFRTAHILQFKPCTDSKQLLQPFYRLDVVLTFKETNHKMHWTMENTLPCRAGHADMSSHFTTTGLNIAGPSTLSSGHEEITTVEPLSDPGEEKNESEPFKEKSAAFSSPHTQTEGSSLDLVEMSETENGNVSSRSEYDAITSISATEGSFLDLLHADTNTSVETDFMESKPTEEASEVFLTSAVPPEPGYREFNTASGNKDQQKISRPKWIW